MSILFTIAKITITEAVRRRFIVAGVLVCAVFVLLAFLPFHPRVPFLTPEERDSLIGAEMAARGSSITAFFSLLFSVALGAGAISGEIERGVLSVVIPKPISRLSVYLGKWLGINVFILPFVVLWTATLQWAIVRHVHHAVPGLWSAIGILMLYPLVFSSLTMLFSAMTSSLLATILPMILASTAWSEGILKAFGNFFHIHVLLTLANVVIYLAPLNPLSRWVEKALDQPILQMVPVSAVRGAPDPPAGPVDMCWIVGYGLIALIAGAVVFQRRDIGS